MKIVIRSVVDRRTSHDFCTGENGRAPPHARRVKTKLFKGRRRQIASNNQREPENQDQIDG